MKNKILLLASVLALALAPSGHAQLQPLFNGPPLVSDQEQLARGQPSGTVIFPTFSLGQELNLAFSLISFPQGGQSATLNQATSSLTIVPSLFTSPTPALGYATGLGTGQTVTQLTNKSTAVVMPNPTFTGTITMNNASLANGATVKFTVTDSAVATSDVVLVNCQSGSITASSAYEFSTNCGNGTFVVNVTNQGTTNSDAIILNFIVLRASGN